MSGGNVLSSQRVGSEQKKTAGDGKNLTNGHQEATRINIGWEERQHNDSQLTGGEPTQSMLAKHLPHTTRNAMQNQFSFDQADRQTTQTRPVEIEGETPTPIGVGRSTQGESFQDNVVSALLPVVGH